MLIVLRVLSPIVALLVKLLVIVHKATCMAVANDTSLCSTILVLFLEFHSGRLG